MHRLLPVSTPSPSAIRFVPAFSMLTSAEHTETARRNGYDHKNPEHRRVPDQILTSNRLKSAG